MKTLLIISDTHSNTTDLKKIEQLMIESDYIIHLGDGIYDMIPYIKQFKEKIFLIDGNCDIFKIGNAEMVLTVENRKLFITHGNKYSVKTGLTNIKQRAKELNCDIVLYGHTHNADIQESDGILLINPGTISHYGIEKSICYLVINDKKAVATINKSIFI